MSMFDISFLEILGLLAVVLCWVFAFVLYRVGASGTVARLLAHLMVVEGFTLATSGVVVDMFNMTIVERFWGSPLGDLSFAIHTLGDCAMLVLYPPFLAVALNTKLTRPFANRRVQIVITVLSLMLFFLVIFGPEEVGTVALYGLLSLAFGFALIAAIHAWYIAPKGIARTRAGVFVIAYGIRDICWGFVYGSAIYRVLIGIYNTVDDPQYVYDIYRISTLIYIPIVAYGILRTQLFDIDLRIRWTIKQSVLGAAVAIIMFLISEVAERLLSGEVGNFQSFVIAALVVIFLTPVQRFADRVARAAMPNTKDTPEYALARKKEVYEAAVTEALQVEGMSQKERNLLNVLRDSLGISLADAEAVEREVMERNVTLAKAA